jgi:hypothetical protein
MRRRLTYANVMATLALFIALGGASYAVVNIPPNSVGTAQLKPHSVGTGQLKNGAVGSDQLKRGSVRVDKLAAASVGSAQLQPNSVGSGQLMPGSVTAREVEPGSLLYEDFSAGEVQAPLLWALGFANGVIASVNNGVTGGGLLGTGSYYVDFNTNLGDCAPVVSVDSAVAQGFADATIDPKNAFQVVVSTFNTSGAPADLSWYLYVLC